jgi:hypothetical protein
MIPHGAYEVAAEKYRGTSVAYLETRCNDNMTGIKMKQWNPDAEVGFHRLLRDVDKSLFYPPAQATARAATRPLVRFTLLIAIVHVSGLFRICRPLAFSNIDD